MSGTGVLLTAFGGPRRMEYVDVFLAEGLGREPSADEAANERLHYLTIGGASPARPFPDRIV